MTVICIEMSLTTQISLLLIVITIMLFGMLVGTLIWDLLNKIHRYYNRKYPRTIQGMIDVLDVSFRWNLQFDWNEFKVIERGKKIWHSELMFDADNDEVVET